MNLDNKKCYASVKDQEDGLDIKIKYLEHEFVPIDDSTKLQDFINLIKMKNNTDNYDRINKYQEEIKKVSDDFKNLKKDYSIYYDQTENIDNKLNNNDIQSIKDKTIVVYRKIEIKPESKTGNFFLIHQNGTINKPYEISYKEEEVLDIADSELEQYKQYPPFYLIDKWFTVEELINEKHNNPKLDKKTLGNRLLCKKLKNMGYKGVKYGSLIFHVI